jgi:hypothetical protein
MIKASHRFLDWLSEQPISKAVDVVTVPVGFSFPWWWPHFKAFSDGSALLIPILTAIFLVVRIWLALRGKESGG